MSQICYAPNAVPIPEYGPCNNNNNNTDSVSLCCSPGQFCLTNGLCANGQGEYYSGACTDKSYKAAICPLFCTGASKFVVQCNNSVIPDGEFCCDANGSGSCCHSANNALELALAVTSATVAPTANSGPTASTSSTQSISRSGTSGENTPSSTTFFTGPTTSFAVNFIGSTRALDSISTRSVTSSTTATLVSASPSPSPNLSNKARELGLEIGLPLVGGLVLFLIAGVFYYKKWKNSRSEGPFTMTRSRIVNRDTSDSEIKVEPIELGANPVRPVEMDSASTPRAPMATSGLSASHEDIDRLAAIQTSAPWDAGHPRLRSTPPPATPTLRPNNPQGPLPLPVFPTVPGVNLRGSSPPAGSAIVQTDGGSTPPPTHASAETSDGREVPIDFLPFHIEGFDGFVTLDGEASDGTVPLDSAVSDGNVPSNGIVAPPNSEAPSSTLVNSSPPSTKSYDSNTKTVLDVGCVLHTAETESEQGDISPLLPVESVEENELSQYLGFVGWAARHENAPTGVGASEAMGSEVTDSSVVPSEFADVRSNLTEPVGDSGDSTLPARGYTL